MINGRKVGTLKLANWKDFFRLFKVFVDGQWVFRGQESAEWHLRSTLERDYAAFERESQRNATERPQQFFVGESVANEKFAIENFRRMADGRLTSQNSLVETLAVMQHYGAKTRLLDFSYSIAVALHFAYATRVTNKPRAVWAVNLGHLISRNEELKDALGRFGKALVESDKKLHVKRCVWMQDIANELAPSIVSLADRCIKGEGSESGILPIQLPGNNERLIAQSGLFLFPKNFKSFEENLSDSLGLDACEVTTITDNFRTGDKFHTYELFDCDLIKIEFDKGMESRTRAILDLMNVSPQNLFPGLEGVAQNVRYAYGKTIDDKGAKSHAMGHCQLHGIG